MQQVFFQQTARGGVSLLILVIAAFVLTVSLRMVKHRYNSIPRTIGTPPPVEAQRHTVASQSTEAKPQTPLASHPFNPLNPPSKPSFKPADRHYRVAPEPPLKEQTAKLGSDVREWSRTQEDMMPGTYYSTNMPRSALEEQQAKADAFEKNSIRDFNDKFGVRISHVRSKLKRCGIDVAEIDAKTYFGDHMNYGTLLGLASSLEDISSQLPVNDSSLNCGSNLHSVQEQKPQVQINNAPYGIAIGGGIVENPTVNNYGLPLPKVSWRIEDKPTLSDAKHPEVWVRISIDRDFLHAKFAVICDRACKAVEGEIILGDGGGIQPSWGSIPNHPEIAAFAVDVPNPMSSDDEYSACVESEDDSPVKIFSVKALIIKKP